MTNETKPVILAVDDEPANLDVAVGLLNDRYRVKVATSGEQALKVASSGSPPDLVLLDILMPGLDGIEVCRKLKEFDQLRDVPVIFISSLEDVTDKVKAFTSGGIDYVTKPFQPEELLARVDTHLTLRRVQKELEEHNNHLDELVRKKSRELAEAHDRLALVARTKGEFLKLISHELRTPANGILGVAEVVIKSCSESEDVIALRPYFEESRDRMISVLDDSLLLAEVDFSQKDFKTVPVSFGEMLVEAFRTTSDFALEQKVEIGRPPLSEAAVDGDRGLFTTSLTAMLMTAVVFTDSGQALTIICSEETDTVTLTLEPAGKQLNEKTIEGFFDLSSSVRSSTRAEILGLKPVVAERVFSLYGGSVHLQNQEGKGTVIQIKLKKSV